MPKKGEKIEELVKGDKLRDLILLVHLNNKYGKGKNEISALKEILDYSTGGIYSALDSSGYFERKLDRIKLTEKGEEYLKNKILPHYDIFKTFGDVLILLGFVFILQWFWWTYRNANLIIPWYSGLSVVILGIFLRFFVLRLKHYMTKRKRIKN